MLTKKLNINTCNTVEKSGARHLHFCQYPPFNVRKEPQVGGFLCSFKSPLRPGREIRDTWSSLPLAKSESEKKVKNVHWRGQKGSQHEHEHTEETKKNDVTFVLKPELGELRCKLQVFKPQAARYYAAILPSIRQDMDLKNFSTSHWCEERESFVEQLKKSLEFVCEKEGTEVGGEWIYDNGERRSLGWTMVIK